MPGTVGNITRRTSMIVSIDPGLGSTGIARWVRGVYTGRWNLIEVELLRAPNTGDLPSRARTLARAVNGFAAEQAYGREAREILLVCELPEYQGGGARGIGWKTGGMQSLTFLVGTIAGLSDYDLVLVNPSEWKGQLSKDIVQRRLIEKIGASKCTALNIRKDGWDAVGIGLWAQGRF